MSELKTMTLNMPANEMAALEAICEQQERSKIAVMRSALRVYQEIQVRLAAGETMHFSGDAGRKVELCLLDITTPPKPAAVCGECGDTGLVTEWTENIASHQSACPSCTGKAKPEGETE